MTAVPAPDIDLDKYYNLRQAAKFCGVSANAVRNWILTGKLPDRKSNGRYMIHENDLIAIKEAREAELQKTAEATN